MTLQPNSQVRLVEATEDLDEQTIQEIITESSRDAVARIPHRYRAATVPLSEVAMWVYDLVGAAVEDRGKRDPIIERGKSLLLAGDVGTGKTWNAYGAILAMAASGARFSWQFLTMADMFASLRPRGDVDTEGEFQRLARVGVLVLDDVGAAKVSMWTEEVLYRLINARYEWERPTLLTTNLGDGLGGMLGDRVTSRLVQMCTQVAVDGPDRRRES